MKFRKPALKGGLADVSAVILPLALAMASNAIMHFTDRVFLARHSTTAIQAALPGGILAFTVIAFFQSMVAYSGTFVAQYHGAKRRVACIRAAAQGLWLSLASAVPIAALIPAGIWCMRLAGHAPDVIAEEKTYYGILMLGGLTLPFSAAITGYFTGRGKTRLTLAVNITGSLANVLLDYLMIFGHWGFPRMGIAGAAWATVISGMVTPLILIAAALREPFLRRVRLRRAMAFDRPLFTDIVRYGAPAGLHTLMDVSLFTVFVMMTGRLESMEFAVSNIGFSINHLFFGPMMGIGIGASIVVGQYQGARDPVSATRAGWSSMKIAWIYMSAFAAVLLLFPHTLMTLFKSPDSNFPPEAFLSLGRSLMILMVAWGFFDAMTLVLGGALKGAGDTHFVMFYMILMGWLLWMPPNVIILRAGGGLLALWQWMTLYTIILSFGILARWLRGRWKTIGLVREKAPARPPAP